MAPCPRAPGGQQKISKPSPAHHSGSCGLQGVQRYSGPASTPMGRHAQPHQTGSYFYYIRQLQHFWFFPIFINLVGEKKHVPPKSVGLQAPYSNGSCGQANDHRQGFGQGSKSFCVHFCPFWLCFVCFSARKRNILTLNFGSLSSGIKILWNKSKMQANLVHFPTHLGASESKWINFGFGAKYSEHFLFTFFSQRDSS